VSGPRITEETLKVLAAIAYLGEATGKQIREKTELSGGTVSPILARLEDAGWLSHRDEAGTRRTLGRPLRMFYRIADARCVALKARELIAMLTDLTENLDV
jgi:PadR family transcriptional regulator, regulatory protein PadR